MKRLTAILILFVLSGYLAVNSFAVNRFEITNDSVAKHLELNLDRYPLQIKFNIQFKLANYYKESKPEFAIKYLKNTINSINEVDNPRYVNLQIESHKLLSTVYENINNPFLSANELIKALSIAKNSQNKLQQLSIHSRLATALKTQANYYEQNKHLKNALQLAEELNKTNFLIPLYKEIATAYTQLSQLDSARLMLQEIISYSKDTSDHASAYLMLARLSTLNKDYPKAIQQLETAIQYAQIADNKSIENQAIKDIAAVYALKQDFTKARHYLALSNGPEEDETLKSILSNAIIYKNSGDEEKAFLYYQKYVHKSDSLLKKIPELSNVLFSTQLQLQQSKIALSDLKVDYFQQQSDIQKNRFLVIVSLTFLLFLIIATYFIINYQNEKNRNLQTISKQKEELTLKIHKEDIRRIELKAAIAELQGQEMERERLAKDLHDSVGGTLAGIKMELESMFDTENKNGQSKYLIDSLQQCYLDVRSISRNISLPNFNSRSLKENIAELLNNFPGTQNINISLDVFPNDGWEDISLKIQKEVYRLIQEGITNIIKHANATEVEIQLVKDRDTLNMILEDNGIGFEVEALTWTGIGIKNMHSRAKILKGELTIESEPNNGTTLNLNIPLEA